MRKIKDVLRLHAAGRSARQIGPSVGVGRSTVAEYLRRVRLQIAPQDLKRGWPDARGTGGRIAMDWVAGCSWNQWPDYRGVRRLTYYNAERPHSALGGRTPEEAHTGNDGIRLAA